MPATTTYSFTEIGTTISVSRGSGLQTGGSVISLGNGNSAVFYFVNDELRTRLVSNDGLTVGPEQYVSASAVVAQLTASGAVQPVSVAQLTNGNVVVTWVSNSSSPEVLYQIFDSALNPVTAALPVAATSGIEGHPDVTALAGGGFAIAYEKHYTSPDVDIMVQRYSAAGAAQGSIIVLDFSGAADGMPSIAGLNDGGMAIAWHRTDVNGNTSMWTAVRNADGTQRSAAAQWDNNGVINRDVEVQALSNGGFAVFYEDSSWTGSASDTDISELRFNANGSVSGNPIRAVQLGNNQQDIVTAASSEGLIIAGFTSQFSSSGIDPDAIAYIIGPDGVAASSALSIAGSGEQEYATGLTWMTADTFRMTYYQGGTGSVTLGDPDSSLNSRAFRVTRTVTADAAGSDIDWSGSIIRTTFNGSGSSDTFLAGNGNDDLSGGGGSDYLAGGGGGDILRSGSGANYLYGGDGNDIIVLDAGSSGDTVDGGTGSDILGVDGVGHTLASLSGIERVVLGVGSQLILTGPQFANGLPLNTIVDGTGSLVVNLSAPGNVFAKLFTFTGTASMTVNGSSGSDIIKLGNAVNTVFAGDGIDNVKGGTQIDTLNGGLGGDKITGGGGADIMTGNGGNDVFKYAAASDSLLSARDRITDFTIGQDRLNFVKIDANAAVAGDQAFNFVGTGAFANTGVGQVRYANSGADLIVQADVNGDGVADMEIILQGLNGQTMTAADFVL